MGIEKWMSTWMGVGKKYKRVLKERDGNTDECWKEIWTSIEKVLRKNIEEC